jgi:hypothetical protein
MRTPGARTAGAPRALLAPFVVALVLAAGGSRALAHGSVPVLYGAGTAAVDGKLGAAEWAGASRIDFPAALPPSDGGGTAPATLFAMNDATTLYLAVRVERPTYGLGTDAQFRFDNDHDGEIETGDEVLGVGVGQYMPLEGSDAYAQPCAPGGPAGCPEPDTWHDGTKDTVVGASFDANATYLELSHPLDSTDDTHDMSLHPGDVAGLLVFLRLWSTTCNGDNCYADSALPARTPACGFVCATDYAHVVVAPDVSPPETTLAGGAGHERVTSDPVANFTATGVDNLTPSDRLTFECSLDDAAFTACGPGISISTRTGRHRLAVRAIDELHNVDQSPAVAEWAVDVDAPARPTIRVRVRRGAARFILAARDLGPVTGVKFRCALDRGTLRPCPARFSRRLRPGKHVIRAEATDAAGNLGDRRTVRFRVR